MSTKITMGDPTIEARGLRLDYDVRTMKHVLYEISGVREEPLGQPTRPRALGCVNCGAPWEAVCSYCGTRA
jgi:hypothetical protein